MGHFKPFKGMGGKRKSNLSAGNEQPTQPTPETEITDQLDQSHSKMHAIQEQTDQVRSIMSQNVATLQERGESLQDLEHKGAILQESSGQFNKNSAQVEKNLKWKQMRRAIIISVVVIVVLAVVAGVAVIMMKKKKKH